MICGVPLLDPTALGARFQIILTIFLTQIAFNFVVGDSLPRVSYSTSLDYYFLANYLFLCFSAIQNLIVYIISSRSDIKVARIIDVVSIFLFVVIHVANSGRFVAKCIRARRAQKKKTILFKQITEANSLFEESQSSNSPLNDVKIE